MARPTISMPDELEERVEMQLSYGDSKSEWIRHATKLRLQIDPILDDLYEPHQSEERVQFVENAVKEAVERELKRAPRNGHDERMERMGPNGETDEEE